MVPPFEEAVFGTEPGQMAALTETDFGFHVIEVTGAREAGTYPIEEVEQGLRRSLEARLAQERVASEAQRIRDRLESADAFDAVATEEGLTVESRFVEAEDRLAGLGASPEFTGTVFDLEVGGVSIPLRVAAGLALVTVDETVPASVAPFAEVETQVRTDLLDEYTKRAAIEAGELAFARNRGFDAIASALNLEPRESGDLAPGQELDGTGGPSAELQAVLFGEGVAVGDIGVIRVPAGAVVYEVTSREPFDPVAFLAARDDLEAEMLARKQNELRQATVERLIEKQEVVINDELVNYLNG